MAKRSPLRIITYRLVGWWLTSFMLILFWILPLLLAVCVGVFSFGCAFVLKEFQKWWGGDDVNTSPWTL